MKKILCLIAVALLIGVSLGFSQEEKPPGKKELLKDAESYFEKENYIAALPIYLELDDLDPAIEYKYKIGICYLYKTDEKQKSIEYLEQVLDKKPKTEDLYFYLGRAYHLYNRFDEAIEFFNDAKNKKTSKENEALIDRLIENCENGKILVAEPLDIEIENIGRPINTEYKEYAPVISSDESVLIYTYRGKRGVGGLQDQYGNPDIRGEYYEDIYITYKLGNAWLEPKSISENINTSSHDASIGLAADGQKLLIYIDMGKTSGDIFISTLDSNRWSVPERLNENINTDAWEGRGSLSADERIIYFSSKRKGGLGGRDIYKSTIGEDGNWGEAVNIGPIINTSYDDDAPFIHPDGKILYFSSRGHNSMGGFDIFRSVLQDDGNWSTPENAGYPINTTDDDKYYVVSANGKRGYYSSGKIGGYGQQDIYIAHLGKTAKKHALILVKGKVTVNDQPAEAVINITHADDNTPHKGSYKSNSATGKYIVMLPAENNYNLSYEVDGYPPHIENVNASEIFTFMEIVIDVKLNNTISKEDGSFRLDIGDAPEVVEEKPKTMGFPVQYLILYSKDVANDIKFSDAEYQKVLAKYGNSTADDLIFKVQIGAYYTPENFNYTYFNDLGNVATQIFKDGITRFTIGNYKTLNEAQKIKQKAVKIGDRDAFITIFYNGERKFLSEMIGK